MATQKIKRLIQNKTRRCPHPVVAVCLFQRKKEEVGTAPKGFWMLYRVHSNCTYWVVAAFDTPYEKLAEEIGERLAKEMNVPFERCHPDEYDCD